MSPGEPAVDLVVEQLRRSVAGGIGTYCRGLIAGVAALPDESRPAVTLVASRSLGPVDPLAALGRPLRTSRLPGPLLVRAWERGVAAGFRGGSRDLVHATSFAAPPCHAGPLVVTVHDLAWRRYPEAYPARGRAFHERALRRVAREAVGVVAVSQLTADELAAAGVGLERSRVRVIEEGVDHLAPPDEAAAAQLLGGLGVDLEAGYLLSVSTIEPRKNLPRLLEAYAAARPELPAPWPLVVVGPAGWGGDSALGARVPAGVVLAGRVVAGALTALYARARCVAYVPLLEGFGLPAAEAMAAGAPVVASAGLPASGGAAFEVEPLDVSSIAAGLVAASSDEAVRARLVAAGAARATGLTWKAAAAAHAAFWRELAAQVGP